MTRICSGIRRSSIGCRKSRARKNITPSQLALAWVLAQGRDMVPIPGTKRRTYLEENVAAVKVQLSKSDLARIEEVAPKGFAAGGRYHDMSTVNV